jgi:hypothetical protein
MQEVVDCTEGRNPYLGFGPNGLQPNDLVVVFLGVETLFVLRASGERQYKLVGEAYVHGIMDGEFAKATLDQKKSKFAENLRRRLTEYGNICWRCILPWRNACEDCSELFRCLIDWIAFSKYIS